MIVAKGIKRDVPRILIQSSDSFNAFADANGNLVISTAVLREMESEDELAALLGHELAHLVLNHPQDKDAMRALPLGLQTAASFKDAAAELKGQRVPQASDPSKLDPNDVSSAQATSVLWSDFLSPSWNRKQETEADEQGFELMRAAGYDPSAFGQLFSKLGVAEARRTERMKVLKKALVARLQEAGSAKTTAAKTSLKGEAVSLTNDAKDAATDAAAEKLVDQIAVFNRSYHSPDERQASLSAYAREHREKKRAPRAPVKFTETLRNGEGGQLLAFDAAAVATMSAIETKDAAKAKEAVQKLGSEDAKPLSPHLYLALGSYHQSFGKKDFGERAAKGWAESSRPPAQAYTWLASYQGKGKNFTGAITTLESGRTRVGASAPFMPQLVAMARAGSDMPLAREYTKECQAVSNDSLTEKLSYWASTNAAPKGLYADCVRALGEQPKDDALTETVKDKARDLKDKIFKKRF
jgi:predicted Zn-dependent protease